MTTWSWNITRDWEQIISISGLPLLWKCSKPEEVTEAHALMDRRRVHHVGWRQRCGKSGDSENGEKNTLLGSAQALFQLHWKINSEGRSIGFVEATVLKSMLLYRSSLASLFVALKSNISWEGAVMLVFYRSRGIDSSMSWLQFGWTAGCSHGNEPWDSARVNAPLSCRAWCSRLIFWWNMFTQSVKYGSVIILVNARWAKGPLFL